MGIFKKLKKVSKTNDENVVQKQEVKEEVKKEPFVADIGLCEFENVNWEEFGRILKQNKILPNSYLKKPSIVDVKLSTKDRPMVLLTFTSATSNSIREFLLLQDKVFQSINGRVDDGKNQELINIWNKFKEEIRYRNFLNTNREEFFQKQKAERMIKTAERNKKRLEDLYKQEQAFLETYQDSIFDGFYYEGLWVDDNEFYRHGELPQFIPLIKVPDGHYISGRGVIPFTPKTLEHCILHMSNGQKIEDGEYPEEFEKKCRQIQEFSGYESEDWDKVIKIGKNIVRKKYEESLIEDYEYNY